jgi:hypothetical protein
VVVIWFFIETAYTRASTLLSWVALWALGCVRASVRARTGGCGSGSSLTKNTPMRKGKQHGHGAPIASLGGRPSGKNSSEKDGGRFKATVTSGTVEVRFMIDPAKRSSFNLCMRLREFVKEAQVMDPIFRIMPLEGEGGNCINQPEDWTNTKEGIDRYYRHWSIPSNVSGKMKVVTKLSLVQLKLTPGSLLTYPRLRVVHINYAQLGFFDTVTLGWVTGAHPSFSYRDEMKDRLGELMKGDHSNLQYALFPWSFHYITYKNKRLTTRGIAIQIMKSDNISPEKFR